MTRLFLHVTLVVDLRERDVLQPLFFGRALLGGGLGSEAVRREPGCAVTLRPKWQAVFVPLTRSSLFSSRP